MDPTKEGKRQRKSDPEVSGGCGVCLKHVERKSKLKVTWLVYRRSLSSVEICFSERVIFFFQFFPSFSLPPSLSLMLGSTIILPKGPFKAGCCGKGNRERMKKRWLLKFVTLNQICFIEIHRGLYKSIIIVVHFFSIVCIPTKKNIFFSYFPTFFI